MVFKILFLYLCRWMREFHKIIVCFLAGIFLMLGTGLGVVHICSAYCITKDCFYTSVPDQCNDDESCQCNSHSGHDLDNAVSVSGKCSCINIKYEVPFVLKISHAKTVHLVPVPVDMPDFLACVINPVVQQLMSAKASNAPPGLGNRILLALHSVLII